MWTADRGAASQLQLTELTEQRVAKRGIRAQVRKSDMKSSPWARDPTRYEKTSIDFESMSTGREGRVGSRLQRMNRDVFTSVLDHDRYTEAKALQVQ